MKKIITVFLSLLGILILSITVYASEDFESVISDKLFSSFDAEIYDALEEFGITDLDYESVYNISFKDIFNYYKESLSDLFTGSMKTFLKLLATVMLVGFASMIIDSEKYKSLMSCLSVMVITIMVVENINYCLNSAISLLKLNGGFIASFVPIYALIIAASGNPTTALTYNSLILAFSEGASALINYGFVEFIGCFFCLSVSFSINDNLNFSRLISVTNKASTILLGFISSVFASVLTLKGFISVSADTVASRGMKFAIGSLVPVIGSSISEAYSVLLGSMNIIKGSVAIIGIIAILIINIPVLIEIMIYYFSFSALSIVSEILDCKSLSNAFSGFSCGIKIIGILAVFEMFILIISTAVMLSFKGA